MAQIEKTAQAEPDMLLWNLWSRAEPLRATSYKSEVTRFGRLGLPALVYGALALGVMLPMLWPGFILTLDMAFTPTLRMPEDISSSYLFHAALHYLNFILPADVIQKSVLLAILLLSGLGAHTLVRHVQNSKNRAGEFALWGAYIAGAMYMINPYTYSRFMAGQYAVLLGYALLPFFVRAVLKFLAVPTLRRALGTAAWAIGISIVSIHTLGLAAILALAATLVHAWRWNKKVAAAAAIYGLIGAAVFLIASGYWLVPLLEGTSVQGQAISQFGADDRQAFATVGGDAIGRLGNVLQLQGFWAEAEGLYLLPQEHLPGWAVIVLAVWVVIGIGARRMWRDHRAAAVLFAAAGITAIVLAIAGAGDSRLLAGFREPHKYIGILALAYAIFAGFGAAAALSWAKKRSETLFAVAAFAVLLLPVLFTPTMFWGFAGQLSPRHYPGDWQQLNAHLNQDPGDFRVLSLPWHLYMHYPFAGRVIVNPSDKFFDKPTIASNELEFKNASPTFPSGVKTLLTTQILPDAPANPQLGQALHELNIKYILLAKTYDYRDYEYLNTHPSLQLIAETPNLRLYRNVSYE